MRLKHCICCLILFITTFAMGQTNTNELTWTFKRSSEWQDTTVRLIVADAPKAEGKAFQEVKANWATYKLNQAFTAKFKPSAPYTVVPEELHVVRFQDPHTKKTIFINRQHFYVSSADGLTGFWLMLWQLWHYSSFLELEESSGEAADIEFFEKTFDVQKAVSAMIAPYEERIILFKHAMPEGYFHDDHKYAAIELKNAEMTNEVLRLDLWNPVRKTSASVWFNLDSRKVIRSKVEGEERNIGDGINDKTPFTVSKKEKLAGQMTSADRLKFAVYLTQPLKAGQPAMMRAVLTNESDREIAWYETNGYRDLTLKLIDAQGNACPFTDFGNKVMGGSGDAWRSVRRFLGSRASHNWEFDLNQLYAIKPGVYNLTATLEPAGTAPLIVKDVACEIK